MTQAGFTIQKPAMSAAEAANPKRKAVPNKPKIQSDIKKLSENFPIAFSVYQQKNLSFLKD